MIRPALLLSFFLTGWAAAASDTSCGNRRAWIDSIADNLEQNGRNYSKEGSGWVQSLVDEKCLGQCNERQLQMLDRLSSPVGPAADKRPQFVIGAKENPEDVKVGTPEDVERRKWAITRQNEAADILAKNGYSVYVNPEASKFPLVRKAYNDEAKRDGVEWMRSPDLMLGPNLKKAKIFDILSSRGSKESILSGMAKKIEKGQTRRVVLYLGDDNAHFRKKEFTLDELRKDIAKQFEDAVARPNPNNSRAFPLEQVIAVVNSGGNVQVVNLFP